jgi:hypothetical protein
MIAGELLGNLSVPIIVFKFSHGSNAIPEHSESSHMNDFKPSVTNL